MCLTGVSIIVESNCVDVRNVIVRAKVSSLLMTEYIPIANKLK